MVSAFGATFNVTALITAATNPMKPNATFPVQRFALVRRFAHVQQFAHIQTFAHVLKFAHVQWLAHVQRFAHVRGFAHVQSFDHVQKFVHVRRFAHVRRVIHVHRFGHVQRFAKGLFLLKDNRVKLPTQGGSRHRGKKSCFDDDECSKWFKMAQNG